eukprot:5450462-Alexandrium_andersonii.AAC.1
MSASLVGSEMCIRDRRRRARRTSRAGPERLPPLVLPPPRTGKVGGRCPVSYTHLTLPTICSV